MINITASVGRKGKNNKEDVKIIQKMLNSYSQKSGNSLVIDGIAGKNTIKAITEFQAGYVKLLSPDGRVDPSGQTMNKLNEIQRTPEEQTQFLADRKEFVNENVKELPLTTFIIDSILPHFKKIDGKVISGYLSTSDLFWKVNYHWDYLLWMVQHSLTLDISPEHVKVLKQMEKNLESCKPDPDSGYRSSPVGIPADKSSEKDFNKRYETVKESKKVFTRLIIDAHLKELSRVRSDTAFDLAAAPVAHPGVSQHKTGYALDIHGNNKDISSTVKKLGATTAFDEKSHVHVEFANGVKE